MNFFAPIEVETPTPVLVETLFPNPSQVRYPTKVPVVKEAFINYPELVPSQTTNPYLVDVNREVLNDANVPTFNRPAPIVSSYCLNRCDQTNPSLWPESSPFHPYGITQNEFTNNARIP